MRTMLELNFWECVDIFVLCWMSNPLFVFHHICFLGCKNNGVAYFKPLVIAIYHVIGAIVYCAYPRKRGTLITVGVLYIRRMFF